MPVFRLQHRLIYFAHVPKCAGTAIERYLADQFGPLAFHDSAFLSQPESERWSQTSPQHIDAASLARIFPEGFFDESFAVIRHPISRLLSVFRFQKEIEGKIAPGTSFADWLETLAAARAQTPWIFDNHTRPMTEMVPPGATIFKLEAGLEALIAWLQGLAGPDLVLPLHVPEANVLSKRLVFEGKEDRPVTVSARARQAIIGLYRNDFDRFGYDPEARVGER